MTDNSRVAIQNSFESETDSVHRIEELEERVEKSHESMMSAISRLLKYTEVQQRVSRQMTPFQMPMAYRTMRVYE